MSIIRSKQRRYFVVLDSIVIENGMLTLPALGLLVTLLNHSDDWQFRPKAIARSLCKTPEAVQPLLDEMLRMGFLVERFDRYGLYYDLVELPPPNYFREYDAAHRADAPAPKKPVPACGPGDAVYPEPDGESSGPMSDERIAYWQNVIHEKYPVKKKVRI